MKTLIGILFLTLLGTIAQAAPDSQPLEFADSHCYYADDSDACRTAIKNDRYTQMMNHYSLAIRICSVTNIKFAAKRSTCFAEAAKLMKDSDFRQEVTDCVHATSIWTGNLKNENWTERAECQNSVFATQAAAVDRKSASGGSSHGSHTRP